MNGKEREELRGLLEELKEEKKRIASAAAFGRSYSGEQLREWKSAFSRLETELEAEFEALPEREQFGARGEAEEAELSVMEDALDILEEALQIAGGNPDSEELKEVSLIVEDVIEELWEIL